MFRTETTREATGGFCRLTNDESKSKGWDTEIVMGAWGFGAKVQNAGHKGWKKTPFSRGCT